MANFPDIKVDFFLQFADLPLEGGEKKFARRLKEIPRDDKRKASLPLFPPTACKDRERMEKRGAI